MIKIISGIIGALLLLLIVNPVITQGQNPIVDLGAEGIKIAGSGSIALIDTIIQTLGASGGLLGALISIVLGIVNGFFSFILSLVSSSIVSCVTSFMSSALVSGIMAIITSIVANILSVINGVVEYASLLCSGALGACYALTDIPLILVWLVAFVIGVPIMAIVFVLGEIAAFILLAAVFIWTLVKLVVGGLAGIIGTIAGLIPIVSIAYGIVAAVLYVLWEVPIFILWMLEGAVLGLEIGFLTILSGFTSLVSPRGGIFMLGGDIVKLLSIIPFLFFWTLQFAFFEQGMIAAGVSSWCGGVQGGFQWVTAWISAIIEMVAIIVIGIIYLTVDIIAVILWIIGIIVTLYDGCREVTKVLDIF